MGEGEESHTETQAHHVGSCPPEDRGGAKVAMGEGAGTTEEGGLGYLLCPYHGDLRLEPVRCFNSDQAHLFLGLQAQRIA